MATILTQTIITPKNIKRYWLTKVEKNEADSQERKAQLNSLMNNKCTYDVTTTVLEDGTVSIVMTHVWTNAEDCDTYLTWWSQFDTERYAYHSANGQTYSLTRTDE